ncbi:MAG: hypothetical protein SGILL_008548 [Bacillariaceae sp.]
MSMMRKTKILETSVLKALHQDTMDSEDKCLLHSYPSVDNKEEKEESDVEMYGTFSRHLPSEVLKNVDTSILSAQSSIIDGDHDQHRIPSGIPVSSLSIASKASVKSKNSQERSPNSQVTFVLPSVSYGRDPEGCRVSQVANVGGTSSLDVQAGDAEEATTDDPRSGRRKKKSKQWLHRFNSQTTS